MALLVTGANAPNLADKVYPPALSLDFTKFNTGAELHAYLAATYKYYDTAHDILKSAVVTAGPNGSKAFQCGISRYENRRNSGFRFNFKKRLPTEIKLSAYVSKLTDTCSFDAGIVWSDPAKPATTQQGGVIIKWGGAPYNNANSGIHTKIITRWPSMNPGRVELVLTPNNAIFFPSIVPMDMVVYNWTNWYDHGTDGSGPYLGQVYWDKLELSFTP